MNKLKPQSETSEIQKWVRQASFGEVKEAVNCVGKITDKVYNLKTFIKVFKEAEKKIISEAKKETTKAFGGCLRCYGKGYATQRRGIHGAEDFGGDGFEIAPREEMNFCSCQRGKDLKKYFERAKKEGWNEAIDEAMTRINWFGVSKFNPVGGISNIEYLEKHKIIGELKSFKK